jgi:hypothetical protein
MWWLKGPTDTRIPMELQRRPKLPSATYTVFRNAILAEQQVTCVYDGRRRELCPHIIGTSKDGDEVVLAWQLAGESSGQLPQWRCLKLEGVRNANARDGQWFAGGIHQTTQACCRRDRSRHQRHVRKLR